MSQPAFPGGVARQDPDLSQRQRDVLEALISVHRRSARPVGSDALARRAGIAWSSASIRATLAELESLGFLHQPHAAAGRVPTDRGYAFFVRNLMTPAGLPFEVLAEIDERLRRSARDVEHLLGEASRLLSSLTHQLGLGITSALEGERLTNLELEPLDERRALLLLTLGVGAVHTLLLQLDSPLEREALAEVAAVLRERLLSRSLSEVRDRLARDPELVRRSAVRVVARAAAASWSDARSTTLFSAGAAHMADHPEFARGAQLAPLLRLIEDGPPLDRLMVEGVEGQPAVRVGLDEDTALAGCSLVTFPLPGTAMAAVGVLGPMRMDYARALAVVDAVGRRVADLL
jgi:heat-inducible transcriptional repressor